MTVQHWVWVTRPEFYLVNGQDRPDLDPARGYDPEGWWTCDPATRDGDLAVLYRSRERKDLGYLIAVRSDAMVLDDPDTVFDGTHVCRYQILARFKDPLSISTMRSDPVIATWPALRSAFVQRASPVPDEVWARLCSRLDMDPAALQSLLATGDRRFRYERDLERWLVTRGAGAFAALGWDMTLLRPQYPCGPGIADLVYTQGRGVRGRRVVVELKRGVVGTLAVEQVRRYRDFLDAEQGRLRRRTAAILVGERLDDRAGEAVHSDSHLAFISIAELQATT